MSYFEFPHTRDYEGDLGFVIKKIIELTEKYNNFFAYNFIKFADPITWNITSQYPAYMIVFDTNNEGAYISKKPVPVGIDISNTDFWEFIGPLVVDAYARTSIEKILHFITGIYETGSTATAVRTAGEYLIVDGKLVKTTTAINIGETYSIGFNIIETTIEDMTIDLINNALPTIDLSLDNTSENPIANKPVAVKFASVDDEIEDINSDIGDINSDISGLDTRIDNLEVVNDGFTVMIGDSYGQGYDPNGNNSGWPTYLRNLGVTGVDNCAGGAGFKLSTSAPNSPITLINNVVLPDGVTNNDVRRVIFAGGYNDSTGDQNTVYTNALTFINTAKTLFPNAKIYIGFIGFAYTNNEDNITGGMLAEASFTYNKACVDSSALFMPQCSGVLLGTPNGLSTADYKHPTASGNIAIAHSIYAALNGQAHVSRCIYKFTLNNNYVSGVLNLWVTVNNGKISGISRFESLSRQTATAESLYQFNCTPDHIPCMPFNQIPVAKIMRNYDTSTGLGKTFYEVTATMEFGYTDHIAFTVPLLNDNQNNFASSNHIDFNNDAKFYEWEASFN